MSLHIYTHGPLPALHIQGPLSQFALRQMFQAFKCPQIIKQKHYPSEVLVSAVQTHHRCPLTPTYTRASERSAS